jgi:hypothetical protein
MGEKTRASADFFPGEGGGPGGGENILFAFKAPKDTIFLTKIKNHTFLPGQGTGCGGGAQEPPLALLCGCPWEDNEISTTNST